MMDCSPIEYSALAFIIKSHVSFGFFYVITIQLGVIYLLFIGWWRKYYFATWSVFVLMVSLFFILGLNISAYSPGEFFDILKGSDFTPHFSKTAPSGFFYGLMGVIIAKHLLRIKIPLADDLVFILPAMSIIQRTGCLLNGCCHGGLTSLPWGIKYTSASFLSSYGPRNALSANHMDYVQAVHPTQLYIMIGSLLILAALLFLRKRFKHRGSIAFAGILLLLILRFAVEFVKLDNGMLWYSYQWYGLKIIQWIIMAGSAFVLLFLLKNEKRRYRDISAIPVQSWQPVLNSIVILALLIMYFLLKDILELSEQMMLTLLFALAIIPNLYLLLKNVFRLSYKRAVVTISILGVLSMGQIAVDTTQNIKEQDMVGSGWFDIGFGVAGGSYDEVHISKDCYGNTISEEHKARKYNQGYINFNYHYKPRINQHFRAGLNAYLMNNSTEERGELSYHDLALNPNFSFDTKYFGFGLGMHISTIERSDSYLARQDILDKAVPSAYLRWGPIKYFFGDIGYFWNFHAIGLPAQFQFGAGSGLGRDDVVLRFGYSNITEQKNLFYLSFEYRIKRLAVLQAGVAVPNEVHGFLGLQFLIGANHDRTPRR